MRSTCIHDTYATFSSVSLREKRQATNASRLRFPPLDWRSHRSRSRLLECLTWQQARSSCSEPTADRQACKDTGCVDSVEGSCCDAQTCLTMGVDSSVERRGGGTANGESLSLRVRLMQWNDIGRMSAACSASLRRTLNLSANKHYYFLCGQ